MPGPRRRFSAAPDPLERILLQQAEELRKLRERVGRLENEHTPTHPVYVDDPDDAVDTQIAFRSVPPGTDGTKPSYYWNGAWHEFATDTGAGGVRDMPWITVEKAGSVPELANYIFFDTLDTETFDTDVFMTDLGTTFPIGLQAQGLYWVMAGFSWESDFGAVECLFDLAIQSEDEAGFGSDLDVVFDDGSMLMNFNQRAADANYHWHYRQVLCAVPAGGRRWPRFLIRNMTGAPRFSRVLMTAIHIADNPTALPPPLTP